MSNATLNLHLRIWRQPGPDDPGAFRDYDLAGVSPNMSFLEMLDLLNERLIERGEDAVAFDSDCREGICGTCCIVIDGRVHGADHGTTVCQLHMRRFRDGQTITVEPIRARPFRLIKDLVVDRSALDRIIQAGGYVSVNTGAAPDAAAIPVPKQTADLAMDAAACIGCGACVAACPNASAMLFTSAKISQLNLLPQGHPERHRRALAMVRQMDAEGFGACTNIGECEATCPKEIRMSNIARMNRHFLLAMLAERNETSSGGTG